MFAINEYDEEILYLCAVQPQAGFLLLIKKNSTDGKSSSMFI